MTEPSLSKLSLAEPQRDVIESVRSLYELQAFSPSGMASKEVKARSPASVLIGVHLAAAAHGSPPAGVAAPVAAAAAASPQESEGGDPEKALLIHPISDRVYVDLVIHTIDSGGKKALAVSHQGAVANEGPLSFDVPGEYPDVCDIALTMFLVPGEEAVSEADLAFGVYSDAPKEARADPEDPHFGSKRGEALILKKQVIRKTGSDLSSQFIDSGADIVDYTFIKEDTPVPADTLLKGSLSTTDGKTFSVAAPTDGAGKVSIPLPAGKIDASLVSKSTGAALLDKKGRPMKIIKIKPIRPIFVTPDDVPKPEDITVITDSNVLVWCGWMHPERPVAVLGDKSGSMASGNRIPCLKKTLVSIFEEASKRKVNVSLSTWNSWTEYCTPSAILPAGAPLPYLTAENRHVVESWVASVHAGGGNDMRYAIEDAIRRHPDVKDVVVMCDGDIRPFSVTGGAAVPPGDQVPRLSSPGSESVGNAFNWPSFRKNYPSIDFHFVAFSEGADHVEMEKMSSIGGGTFTSANK